MPAANVTVSAEFEKKSYTVTITQPAAGGTVAVAKTGEGTPAVNSGDKLNHGDTFTVTATPATGYATASVTVMQGETALTAADGVYTITGDVTVTAAFEKTPVAAYDFEGETPATFVDKSADGNRITLSVEEDTTLNSKVQKINNGNHNERANALLDFSDAVANATAATIDFDVYFTDGACAFVTLGDYAKRGNDAGGSVGSSNDFTYGTNGAVFNIAKKAGRNKTVHVSDTAIAEPGEGEEKVTYSSKWLHVNVAADYKTGKVNYTVTYNNETIASGEKDYIDKTARAINCIDVFMHNKDNYVLLDNIKVFAEIGTGNTVTINYVDGEGAAVKEAKTVAAVNTLPYTVDAAEKATFEANNVIYNYKAEGSTDTIAAVSDEAKTITLVFDKVAKQTTTFTAKIGEEAKAGVPIKVKGTPTDTFAQAVDTTVTTGENGTATIDLYPGTYTYAIDETTEYFAVADTAVTVGQNNDVALTANSKQATKITVKYMVSGATDPVKTAEITDGVYVGESYTIADTYKAAFNVADETAGTFKRYTYVSGELAVASPVAENNDVVITVATDGVDYYAYEDYEEYDADAKVTPAWTGLDGVVKLDGENKRAVATATSGSNVTVVTSAFSTADAMATVEFSMKLGASKQAKSTHIAIGASDYARGASNWPTDADKNFCLFLESAGTTGTTLFQVWPDSNVWVDLANDAEYIFIIEEQTDGILLSIKKSDGTFAPIVDSTGTASTYDEGKTTYNRVKFAASDFAKMSVKGLGSMMFQPEKTGRTFSIDNVKAYKPTATTE